MFVKGRIFCYNTVKLVYMQRACCGYVVLGYLDIVTLNDYDNINLLIMFNFPGMNAQGLRVSRF